MSKTSRKPDRRVQRTRELLRDALITLTQEKSYETITVQDITDQANVARTTFYLHFRDKDELLFSTMEDVYNDLIAQIQQASEQGQKSAPLNMADSADWEHVARYADFYRIMLSENGSAAFLSRLWNFLSQVFYEQILKPMQSPDTPPTVSLELIAYFMAGAQIGLVKGWLESGMAYSPEEIAHIGQNLGLQGIQWAFQSQETEEK